MAKIGWSYLVYSISYTILDLPVALNGSDAVVDQDLQQQRCSRASPEMRTVKTADLKDQYI